MADTRKDKRAPVSLKVRFKSATVDEFIEQYCRDVSRGGIFIKSSQPMAIGTLLKFQLQLKDESSLIKGVGRVVWTRSEDDASSEAPAGMGIKFIKMDGDSRTVVDRIVGAQGGEPGSYDQGEPQGGNSDAPPANGAGGGFFPDLPAPVLPPPEDRTAVRHAAQFLASALSEGGTDQAASREAEQKAEEARRRTAQIEAQRLSDAELQKKAQVSPEALPSMIIDPSLSMPPPPMAAPDDDRPTYPREAPTSERPTSQREKPKPQVHSASREELGGEDTSITERRKSDIAALNSTVKIQAPRKSNVLPILVIVVVVALAAVLALRPENEPEPVEPAMIKPVAEAKVAEAPEPEPAAEPEPVPTPEPAVVQPSPEPAPVPAPAAEPVAMVSVKVSSVPEGAEIFVGEESRGKAPLTLELPEGKVATLRARSAGRAEASQEIRVEAKQKPVKLSLLPLPYVLHVETSPPGAVVFVGSKRGTSPVDLPLGGAPKGPLTVTARLSGHETGTTTVAVTTFEEADQAMRSSVSLTLAANKPAPAPAPVLPKPKPATKPVEARPEPVEAAPKPVEAAPKPVEAAPKPVEAAPKPPKPAKPVRPAKPAPEQPSEPIPDNPFG